MCQSTELREFLSQRATAPLAEADKANEFGDIATPLPSRDHGANSSIPGYLRRGMTAISSAAVDTLVKPISYAIEDIFPTPAPTPSADATRVRRGAPLYVLARPVCADPSLCDAAARASRCDGCPTRQARAATAQSSEATAHPPSGLGAGVLTDAWKDGGVQDTAADMGDGISTMRGERYCHGSARVHTSADAALTLRSVVRRGSVRQTLFSAWRR